jgi:hypothetical protein
MTNKLSKCTIVFSIGVTISLASMAFMNQFMQMPQQMMQGSMQMMNQPQSCECSCPVPK